MTTDMERELGERAYDAYGSSVDWKNYQGYPMPMWNELSPRIQAAWVTAAAEVMNGCAEFIHAEQERRAAWHADKSRKLAAEEPYYWETEPGMRVAESLLWRGKA